MQQVLQRYDKLKSVTNINRIQTCVSPSTMYKNSKNIERTLFRWTKIKTRTFSKNVKIHPQEYVLQGSPPVLSTKTPKNIERNLFLCAIIKTRTFSKYVKIDPQDYDLQGSPPLLSTKTGKTQNELCLDGRKLKHDFLGIRFTGVPPSTIYKNSINIEGTLF